MHNEEERSERRPMRGPGGRGMGTGEKAKVS